MNRILNLKTLSGLAASAFAMVSLTSCMTTYDANDPYASGYGDPYNQGYNPSATSGYDVYGRPIAQAPASTPSGYRPSTTQPAPVSMGYPQQQQPIGYPQPQPSYPPQQQPYGYPQQQQPVGYPQPQPTYPNTQPQPQYGGYQVPEPAPTYSPPAPAPTPVVVGGSGGSYVVQPGDTLWSIGQRYQVSVEALKSANSIPANSNTIHIGQGLMIP